MSALIVIIILVVAWPYIWRWLRPYVYRWAQRRAENYIRRAAGMPPRGSSGSDSRSSASSRKSGYYTRTRKSSRSNSGPVIPKEYAEDVEFTEIHSYSEEHTIAGKESVSYRRESQVSDAEIITITKE